MNWDRPADEGDVPILGRLFGAGGGENIFDFVPHASEILPQRKNVVVNSAGVNIIIGGNEHDFHLTPDSCSPQSSQRPPIH